MRIAYFDCACGASGDMVLAALAAAGVPFDELRRRLETLPIADEFSLSMERVQRAGLAALRVRVDAAEFHAHRRLRDVFDILDASGLSEKARADAKAVFQRLAEAEARVHDTTPDQIHFHEVGAVDSIVDIAGAAVGLELLAAERVLVSPIRTGAGVIECAHGRLHAPAPATAELLKEFPSVGSDLPYELTTPTGAAILTTLGRPAPARPAFASYELGYGAGGRDIPETPNVLRLFVGETAAPDGRDVVWELEANLDDLSPEILAYACERLFAAGALDVFTSPIGMKKGRPGVLLRALVEDERLAAVQDALFRETTTLGARRRRVERVKLARSVRTVDTPYGPVRVKIGERNGETLVIAPEYEDCRRAAQDSGAALRQVYDAAARAARS